MEYTLETKSRPRTVLVEKVRTETPTVKSLVFLDRLCEKAKPGQFIMAWIPGVDEIPMSITHELDSENPMVFIKAVGEATLAFHKLKNGDKIGIRGPYGSYFKCDSKKKNLVAVGGIGIAPLIDIIINSKSEKVNIAYGAREKSELILLDEIEKRVKRPLIVTDDGSYGVKGQLSEVLKKSLTVKRYDHILCCGPELMIKKIYDIAVHFGVHIQASLERIMKCGVGICGSCVIGEYRVCKDGPVFSSKDLKHMDELGSSTRDHSGRQMPIPK